MFEENKRDPEASEELTASDFINHADQEVSGLEGAKWFHEEPYREASHADVAMEERLLLP